MSSFSASPTWSTKPTTGFGARSTSLWVHRNLFWQPSRDTHTHKLVWFGHVTRHDSLSILQNTLEGGRRHGRQRKCLMDNIKEWASLPMTELLTMASRRKDWKRISAKLSLIPPPSPAPHDQISRGTELNRSEQYICHKNKMLKQQQQQKQN